MFERNKNGEPILKLNPMASNVLPNGETLYTKVHGVKDSFAAGETKTLEFDVPYTKCMFMGAEIIYNVISTSNMKVTHPILGDLEQYGFNVNIGELYAQESKYGAELEAGLKLKCEVTNTSTVTMVIGTNFLIYDIRAAV